MDPSQAEIYYDGKCLKIIFAVTANDKLPAKDYLDELLRTSSEDWDRIRRILCRLGDRGRVFNKQQFRSVGNGIFEVKAGSRRVLGCYVKAGYFALLCGFKKRGRKLPKTEKTKALKIRSEFEAKLAGQFQRGEKT